MADEITKPTHRVVRWNGSQWIRHANNLSEADARQLAGVLKFAKVEEMSAAFKADAPPPADFKPQA